MGKAPQTQPTTADRLARLQTGRGPGRTRKAAAPPVEEIEGDDLPEAGFEPAPRRRAARQPARATNRDTIENTRRGAVVVTGRDGETLTRRRTQVGDKFHVPGNEIPTGWDYQWNPVTILNQEQVAQQNQHYENGWRPVPAERHAGRWTRPGHTGDIVVEGLRLEERPEALTDEALHEGEMKARRQVRDQADILKLGSRMPEGFSMKKDGRAGRLSPGGSVSVSIDKSMELPPGEYQYDTE